MNKQQLKKNRLDLEYHGEIQKRNAILILLTTGLLSFLGSFIWLSQNNIFRIGIIITAVITLLCIMFYSVSSHRMNEILAEIENM